MEILINRAKRMKEKPVADKLGFGKYFTDHMFVMDYDISKGWTDARIVPYEPLSFDPSCSVFHYGQATFEGLKAYKSSDNKTLLFRPLDNIRRMNLSNERLSIPMIDETTAMNAIKTLVSLEKDWIPGAKNTSLYIRPFVIATDPYLGIRASETYKFIIILSPVGCYYPEGINPVKIYVEYNYSRVAKGMGTAKTPGNYAASIKAQIEAKKMGFTQVLWLDSFEKKYVEEVGSMNVFFKIGDEVVTPALNGSILDGIIRRSVIELLGDWGIKCIERNVAVDEIYEAAKNGSLKEAFGTGTAAVISPIGEFMMKSGSVKVNGGNTGELSMRLYETLTGIQIGDIKDTHGWVMQI